MQPSSVVYITQGECRISNDPGEQISTVLGSCVAACLWDPQAAVGGMNHFLLPFGTGGAATSNLRYGIHSMETLINELLTRGASRRTLQAKLFGGASMSAKLGDIGSENARFAREYLENEDILCAASDLGGVYARRVQFRPVSGQARVMQVRSTDVGQPADVLAVLPERRRSDCVLF
jgi:chemotaxis protein CheD